MRKSDSPQLSQVLLVLANINDNIRKIEDNLFDIGAKLARIDTEKETTIKHLVVIKESPTKAK